MKRKLYIALFLLPATLCCPLVSAQSFVGMSLGGNIVRTVDRLSTTRARLSGGGEAGLAYGWQKEHFLFQTGVHYAFQSPVLSVNGQWLEQEMLDTRGMPFTYRGFLDKRTDRLYMHQLTVPLLVGGTWSGFYVLAGVKIGVNLSTTALQKGALRTVGDYQGRYYDLFENMPNHGYHDFEDVQTRHSLTLNRFDLRLAAETGYTFVLKSSPKRKRSTILRTGLFAEYGLLNMHTGKSNEPLVAADWSQYLHVQMTHIYASKESAGTRANMLLYGIRLTLLFPVSEAPSPRSSCHCR